MWLVCHISLMSVIQPALKFEQEMAIGHHCLILMVGKGLIIVAEKEYLFQRRGGGGGFALGEDHDYD